jgi:hypothetical protein
MYVHMYVEARRYLHTYIRRTYFREIKLFIMAIFALKYLFKIFNFIKPIEKNYKVLGHIRYGSTWMNNFKHQFRQSFGTHGFVWTVLFEQFCSNSFVRSVSSKFWHARFSSNKAGLFYSFKRSRSGGLQKQAEASVNQFVLFV